MVNEPRYRSHVARQRLLASVLMGSIAISGLANSTFAQDATPQASPTANVPRPANIHTGVCEQVGDVVAPLVDLVSPVGDALGQGTAVTAETSFTSVPLTLDQMLAAEHVVSVHLAADDIDVYIACGEIGGVLDANGALVIGLSEQSDSGYSGIAFLSPGTDGASTDISVFVAGSE